MEVSRGSVERAADLLLSQTKEEEDPVAPAAPEFPAEWEGKLSDLQAMHESTN